MNTPEEILQKYFGHAAFRPLQKDIINNILSGKDTIALLPTGGGKSVCFQVPALMMNGVCIVVTPLIALMKDQVENLRNKDIMAIALYSGMSKREIEFELENCINGKYKFLYVSPERLKSKHFNDYARNINVSLLAIDEAHCISQWGYDFRPPYLNIATFRNYYQKLPCIALTASATEQVIEDIGKRLEMRKPTVFKQSFVRKNLAYVVQNEENKTDKIAHIVSRIKGTGLIYVRSRKKTVELTKLLQQKNISVDYYHAGLDAAERNRKQEAWKNNAIRVMICTNAFGMGIDKPDVRFVIHESKPETLEAYYQEAGRAGRDGKKSYCIFLHHASDDRNDEENIHTKYPSPADIKRVYELVFTYLNVAVESGGGQAFPFNLNTFINLYKLPVSIAVNSLRMLENEGYFQLSDAVHFPSRIKILCDYQTLYEWQMNHPVIDEIFKVLLRSYGGLFDFYTNIFEREIAFRLKKTEVWVQTQLEKIKAAGLIDYIKASGEEQIFLQENRFRDIDIPAAKIQFLRSRYKEKLLAVNNYVHNTSTCRSALLVSYFNEKNSTPCGVCDICLSRKKQNDSGKQFKIYYHKINHLFEHKNFKAGDLNKYVNATEIEEYTVILRWLKDNGYAAETAEGQWQWTNRAK